MPPAAITAETPTANQVPLSLKIPPTPLLEIGGRCDDGGGCAVVENRAFLAAIRPTAFRNNIFLMKNVEKYIYLLRYCIEERSISEFAM